MEILQKDDGKKGKFYVEIDQTELAEMTYVWAGKDRIIIDHTEVDTQLEGKGIGKEMVHKAVEFAREKGINIIPLCPFAKAIFDKEIALRDVL
jgi:predicted GNAT family acetyltransferase